MAGVVVRLYAELSDLLPPERRGRDFVVESQPGRTVKDLIEGLGVPHTEVDLVLVDGVSVCFEHALAGGERVSAFPVFEALDVSSVTRVRVKPLRETRFIADVHLGRLAALLRLAGFDTFYANDAEDGDIALTASRHRRIVLTRDRGLLKRSIVSHGYLVRSTDPKAQLREVLERFDLLDSMRPFSRCSVCNGIIEEVGREEVLPRLPARTAHTQEEFARCRTCGRVYWQGTHYSALARLFDSLGGGGGPICGGAGAQEHGEP